MEHSQHPDPVGLERTFSHQVDPPRKDDVSLVFPRPTVHFRPVSERLSSFGPVKHVLHPYSVYLAEAQGFPARRYQNHNPRDWNLRAC